MTVISLAGIFAALFLASLLGTRLLVTILTRHRIVDIPNRRSSHAVAKPRGGGIAVIAVLLVGWAGLAAFNGQFDAGPMAIAGLTLGLAILSFIDDLHNLSARLRLLVQAICVGAGLWLSVPATGASGGLLPLWLELPLLGLAWLWLVNLYNFMDGIDGITGVETISISAGILLLCLLAPASIPASVMAPALAMLAATAGFLVWNWQPSRIFIGDVASIPLGFLIGWLLLTSAIASGNGNTGSGNGNIPAALLLLPAYYLVDATLTLLKRAWRRENLLQAHRQHFYQQAVQNGFSHAGACLAIAALNAGLLLLACLLAPHWPLAALVTGYGAAAALCLLFRRGRRQKERQAVRRG